jgi:O-antigen ligase
MAQRAVWRPPWQAWASLGILALAAAYKIEPTRLEGHWLVLTPLAIAIGILVLRRLWALPPAVTMCAAIALTVFSGGWSQMGFSGIPVNRLLIAVALLQVFLLAPGVTQIPRIRVRPVHLLMALTVFYALVSAAASGTLGSERSFLALFDVFGVAPFLLFLIAPAVFSRRQDRDLLLATLVGLGAYLGLTAIFESLGPHGLIFPNYIHLADLASGGAVKAGGPFQSPTAAGFANFACAVAAMIALRQWRDHRARYFAAFVAVVCLFGCFLTLERGVWIAALAGTVAAALASRTGRRWLVPGLALAAIAIATTLAVSSQLSEQTSARATYEQSVWDRQNQTATGLRMVAAKPLFGFGFDRYEAAAVDYFRQPADYPMSGYFHGVTIGVPDSILPIHDTYLSYAVELGLFGALLWLTSILWAVGSGIFTRGPAELRPWKIGLLAISVFFLVVSFVDPHTAPYPMVLLFVWAGLATGQRQPQESRALAQSTLNPAPTPA